MPDVILLNTKEHHFNEADLPCLIHYAPHAGGSHFTVTMVADLFLQGSKILFLTGYSYAKDNFLQQIKGNESKSAFITNVNQLNADTQAIILESGNEQLFHEVLRQLKDLPERVVLIKNVELFSNEVINSIEGLEKVILSGDIDKCSVKKQIIDKQYKTKILFSKPELSLGVEPPTLEKYIGYLWGTGTEGRVSILKEID